MINVYNSCNNSNYNNNDNSNNNNDNNNDILPTPTLTVRESAQGRDLRVQSSQVRKGGRHVQLVHPEQGLCPPQLENPLQGSPDLHLFRSLLYLYQPVQVVDGVHSRHESPLQKPQTYRRSSPLVRRR